LAHRGSREVSALKLAESSQRCTAMIGVSGSGHKFPPYIVYKGADTAGGLINRHLRQVEAAARHNPNLEEWLGYPTSNLYAVQAKAWMSSNLVVDWVEKVIRPWTESKDGPCMIILDEFTGHMTCEVRDAIVDCGAFVEYVPGGYTWRLQVMDVGVNKPFKDYIRDEFDRWFFGRAINAKPQREDVARWIKKAFESIKDSTIKKTWNKVGIPCPPDDDDNNNDNEDEDEENNEDGAGVDFLNYTVLGVDEYSAEELEAEEMYSDIND
jgi:DDE superfamily endonuclease